MGIPILSFFTGGGFLDIGFEQESFEVIWTNEVDPVFADLYEFGITSWRASHDCQSVSPARVSERRSIAELSARQVAKAAFGSAPPRVFGVIGGPPCPDFSASGANNGVLGERGRLTQVYADMVLDLRPSFFVLENVPGLERQHKHRVYLEKLLSQFRHSPCSYAVDSQVLDALEYGVPQTRERLFIVGVRHDMIEDFIPLSDLTSGQHWFPWPKPLYPRIKRLEWPTVQRDGEPPHKPTGLPEELMVFMHVSDDIGNLPNGTEVFVAHSRKFWEIPEGDISGKSFKRLHRYRYSPTAWYGNNEVHLHPWNPRRLTVREALRVQSVPDTYVLPPNLPLAKKFKIITNGVPCKLAQSVARSMSDFMMSIGHSAPPSEAVGTSDEAT